MNKIQEEGITFNFLSDDPGKEDGFSGKGHERSARMLTDALVKFSDKDCAIGLEGSWGSGKTTVVSIAEQQLQHSHPETFTFFTFDLWSNQSVDFRRAFLEEFLRWSKSALKGKYQNIERRVQGKTKTVETESEREFSGFGYILMSALFFLPFLVLWLSPFSANLHRSSSATEPNNSELPLVFQLFYEYGHMAALILVAIVIGGFIYQTYCFWRIKKSIRKAVNASFSLFSRKSDKDTVIQTIRDGDPTQFEFHEIFTEILSNIQDANHRVVFVIDNIDRLSADRIQETWADVRSIFSRTSSEKKHVNSTVTAVVPYDRAQVLSAFDKSEADSVQKTDDLKNLPKSVYLLEDVIRKTFNAVITVSPPVTSHVQEFFDNCLDHSLPEQFTDGQKYRLFQIFDFFLTQNSINPTPRQVKSFINDVGMLWQQWRKDISIEAIAVFVLHRSKLEAEPKALQHPDTIHTRYRHFVKTGVLDQELAALAYNVDPGIAFEVLLERDITAALLNQDRDRLSELATSSGFKHQLDRILDKHCSDWASNSLSDFEAALANYTKLNIDISVKELCNKHFVRAISSLAKFDLKEWESHTDLFQIISCIPEDTFLSNIKGIAKWLRESLPDELTRELGRAWIKLFGGFLQEAKKTHTPGLVASAAASVSIPYSPEFYLGVALDCDEVDMHFSQFMNIAKQKSSEISVQLVAYSIKRPSGFSYAWRELQFALENEDRATVFTKILEQLQNSLLDGEDERQAYLENMVLIAANSRTDANVVSGISASMSDGTLAWHAAKLNEAEDKNGLAQVVWLTSLAIKTNPLPALSSTSKSPFGDVTASHSWFSECYNGTIPPGTLDPIADLIIQHDKVDVWLSNFAKKPNHKLYENVLTKVFSADSCPALNVQTLITYYPFLAEHFSEKTNKEMVRKIGQTVIPDKFSKIEISSLPPALVRDIKSSPQDTWASLLTRIDQYLKELTSADWEEALADDNHDRKLLIARGDILEGKVPPNQLRAPLADLMAKIMTSNEVKDEIYKNHSIFWLALPKNSRKGIAKDVIERIAEKPINSGGALVAMSVFPGLFAEFPLKDHYNVAVSKILLPLLTGSLEKTLTYVGANQSAWARCIEAADSELTAQVNDYLLAFDNKEETEKIQVERFRKILKLRKLSTKEKPIQSDGAQSNLDDAM